MLSASRLASLIDVLLEAASLAALSVDCDLLNLSLIEALVLVDVERLA